MKFLKKPVIVKKSSEQTERDVRIKRMGGVPPRNQRASTKNTPSASTAADSDSNSRRPSGLGARQNSQGLVSKYK